VREKNTIKNVLAINQPREDLELRNSYSTVSTVQVRYVYCTSLVLKQKRGLELEMEYSAVHEGYMYVCIRLCARYQANLYTMHCMCGLELVREFMLPTL
jgi:hypothetical protein